MLTTDTRTVPAPTLEVPCAALVEMRAQAGRSYPEECCGVLLGYPPSRHRHGQIVAVVPTTNVEAQAERGRGYRIAPSDVLAARRRARELGLAIVGFYHSHPDRPPVPSSRDHREAWPENSYLILGIEPGGGGEVRSWRLDADRRHLVEERLLVGSARSGSSEPSLRPRAGARP